GIARRLPGSRPQSTGAEAAGTVMPWRLQPVRWRAISVGNWGLWKTDGRMSPRRDHPGVRVSEIAGHSDCGDRGPRGPARVGHVNADPARGRLCGGDDAAGISDP